MKTENGLDVLDVCLDCLDILLTPFSLIRDFEKQNTRGNVSKISVSLACY